MINQSNEQKLVDICFQLAITVNNNHKYFKKLSNAEVANWVAAQLKDCGVNTKPCGVSWGVLSHND